MNIGPAQNTQEAATALLSLRRYAPFRFGGKWHVAAINGEGVAYRAVEDLRKRALKAGVTTFEMAVV